jgi:AGCS family alanine or glycine:cation symporter
VDLLLYRERLGVKWFAVLFAVVSIISAGVLLPGVQANSVADGIQNAFEIDTWKSGIVVSNLVLLFWVKNAKFTEFVVPIMAIIYIVITVIIVIDIDQLPGVIALVFKSAFNMEAGFGVFLAVQWGVKEGFILMKQVKGQRRILPRQQMFLTLLNKVSPIILSLYRYLISMFSYGVHVTDNGKYNVQNPVLGADGATQFYTKEQKMFLLVPDLHNLQWIAFFLVFLTL